MSLGVKLQDSWITLIFLYHSGDGMLLDTSNSPKHSRNFHATYISGRSDILVPKLCHRFEYTGEVKQDIDFKEFCK